MYKKLSNLFRNQESHYLYHLQRGYTTSYPETIQITHMQYNYTCGCKKKKQKPRTKNSWTLKNGEGISRTEKVTRIPKESAVLWKVTSIFVNFTNFLFSLTLSLSRPLDRFILFHSLFHFRLRTGVFALSHSVSHAFSLTPCSVSLVSSFNSPSSRLHSIYETTETENKRGVSMLVSTTHLDMTASGRYIIIIILNVFSYVFTLCNTCLLSYTITLYHLFSRSAFFSHRFLFLVPRRRSASLQNETGKKKNK